MNEGFRLSAALSLRDGCAFYAELARRGEKLCLVDGDVLSLPPGTFQNDRILDAPALGVFLRRELAFRWRKLPFVIGIPSSDCLFRTVSLPEMDIGEVRSAIFWSFSELFAYGAGDALFDVCPVQTPNPARGKMEVVAAVSLRSKLMPLFDALTNSRSCVSAAEPQITACARALTPRSGGGGLSLLAVLFHGAAHIVLLFGHSGLLFRTIAFEDDSSEFEKTGRVQAVCGEIERTLSYASSAYGAPNVEELKLAGAEELCDELIPLLKFRGRVVRTSVKDYYNLSFLPPADENWLDVAGLVLRHADEDGI